MLQAPYALFLGDVVDPLDAKTASGLLQWRPERCVAQVRLPQAGVKLALPDTSPEGAARLGARTLVVGVAPAGGRLQPAWTEPLIAALEAGLDLAAGLHQRLGEVPELAATARRLGRAIHDIRHPREAFDVGNGRRRPGRRVLTVGTDCAVGKKYAALALAAALRAEGVDADFRATGQTGIFIAGAGICIDAVVADFISGAAEALSPAADPSHWDVIEGQGSLFHPAYAGVSLGLLHGSQPDALVVCDEVGRPHMDGLAGRPVPNLEACADANLAAARLTNPGVALAGFSLNTARLDAAAARAYLQGVEARFNLPAVDPIRFGIAPLAARLIRDFAMSTDVRRPAV